MQKIEVDRTICPGPSRLVIAAAALAAGLIVQTPGFAQAGINTSARAAATAPTTTEPEQTARKTWHEVMRNTPVPGKGCFHVSYPNVAWESVECKETKPRPLAPANRTVGAPDAGGGDDYFTGSAQGLITSAFGKFFISGVNSETNVTTASTPAGSDPPLGSNEYSLQINTNDAQTAACGDYGTCYVWQQFVYATDYGEAALFMQYWLMNWHGTCPKGWWTGSAGQCYHNSKAASVPNIPVTNLGDVILTASVENGGNDYVWLEYGDDSWVVGNKDSSAPCCAGGLDIASVWNQAEFNVFGDTSSTQAQFNLGSQIIVVLALLDGSQSAPQCVSPQNNYEGGTTAETNNMNLGTCGGGVGNVIDWYRCTENICESSEIYGPYIEFTENVPFPHLPPPVCIVCTLQVAPQAEGGSNGTTSDGRTNLN